MRDLLVFGGFGYNTLLTRDKDDWVHSEKYTEYDTSNNMLMFVSFVIPSSTFYSKAGVQNILLDTGVKCGVNDAVSIWNKTATDDKRLFLNTHKICTYKSPKTGLDYLFYCYCYPGKSKQLYLGYAPYYIDKKDNYNVVLLTKTEFRDKEGNSFGTFKSCSRIISMDCRNGQLWITWMNKDNSMYSVFHIKAEDLIGD